MSKGAAVNQLRALMEISVARLDRPGEWQQRYEWRFPSHVLTARANGNNAMTTSPARWTAPTSSLGKRQKLTPSTCDTTKRQ
jgi:hypothetical protein